jgi:exonuclease III
MMKIISWNVRGLNERTKQRILCNCIMAEDPNILFLHETKCAGDTTRKFFRRCWRHCNFIYNDSNGEARGLVILWNPSNVIIDQPFFVAITMLVHYHAVGSNKAGVLTNAYGPQNNQEKDLFLNSLSYLGRLIGKRCWILGGYFNIFQTLE